jgi:alpha-L-fucosidase
MNGEAIYGTSASPFKKLEWGRCTHKTVGDKELFYFGVFDFPENGILSIPGLAGKIYKAYPLTNKDLSLNVTANGSNPQIDLKPVAKDSLTAIIVAEVSKNYRVYNAPEILADYDVFMDSVQVKIFEENDNVIIHYTIDGSDPTNSSPIAEGIDKISLPASFTLKAACFVDGKQVGDVSEKYFSKETPLPGININVQPGLQYSYYLGQWSRLPNFDTVKIVEKGICKQPGLTVKKQENNYGLVFTGYLNVPETNIYQFQLTSDDGSMLRIDRKTLMNDFQHGMETKIMNIVLEKGLHPVEIKFFQAGGGDGLTINWKIGNKPETEIPVEFWGH